MVNRLTFDFIRWRVVGSVIAFILAFISSHFLFGRHGVIYDLLRASSIAFWVLGLISMFSIAKNMMRITFSKDLRVGREPFYKVSKGSAIRAELFNEAGLVLRKKLIIDVTVFLGAIAVGAGAAVVSTKLVGGG